MSEIIDLTGERPAKRPRLSPDAATTQEHDAILRNSLGSTKNVITADLSDAAKEIEIGVTEFVSQDVIPFQAILKKRYTDFMVNEVLSDQQVVHLTETSVPKQLHPSGPSKKSQEKQPSADASKLNGAVEQADAVPATSGEIDQQEKAEDKVKDAAASAPAPDAISDEDKQKLINYLNERAVTELLALYKAIIDHPTRRPKDHTMVRTEFTEDRDVRTEIHGAIRRIFASKVESSTDKEGFLCLTAANANNRRQQPIQNNGDKPYFPGKLGWLERGGEYLHFTLYKENKDTMEAIGFLTRQLRISAKAFQFAGTKDRRAVTAQRVSAHRVDAERLAKQNHHLRMAAVGNFEYKRSGLELGELGGNEFVLTLRECQFQDISNPTTEENIAKIQTALETALSNLYTRGYLNYYGLQRFGTFQTRTDTIGLHILKNDFRSACEAILQYDPSILNTSNSENEAATPEEPAQSGPGRDELQRAQAIHIFRKDENAHKAIGMLPKKFSAENQLIRHLARSPTDYVGALLTIPRNLRLMYVHAYQSLVWNKATSNRWQTYGSQVVEGDLVLIKEHRDKEVLLSGPVSAAETGTVDADGEIIIAPSAHDRSSQIDDVFDRARALTAAEAQSGEYSIFDVVMPLPGYDVLYPPNSKFYKTFMASDAGGRLDPYDMRRKQKDFSLSGGYRKILTRIGQDFSVEVHKYSKDEEQFVQTDLEKIQARKKNEEKKDEDTKMTEANVEKTIEEDSAEAAKEKIAAVLKFQLGASQYATMALRELSRGGIVAYKADFGGGRG